MNCECKKKLDHFGKIIISFEFHQQNSHKNALVVVVNSLIGMQSSLTYDGLSLFSKISQCVTYR